LNFRYVWLQEDGSVRKCVYIQIHVLDLVVLHVRKGNCSQDSFVRLC